MTTPTSENTYKGARADVDQALALLERALREHATSTTRRAEMQDLLKRRRSYMTNRELKALTRRINRAFEPVQDLYWKAYLCLDWGHSGGGYFLPLGDPISTAWFQACQSFTRPFEENIDQIHAAIAACRLLREKIDSTTVEEREQALNEFAYGLQQMVANYMLELESHADPCPVCGVKTTPARSEINWQRRSRDLVYQCPQMHYWVRYDVPSGRKHE